MAKTSKKRNKLRERVNALKGKHGCYQCGYHKCITALQFHHIDPSTKLDTISTLLGKAGKQRVQDELHKCVILCANCHIEVEMGHSHLKKGFPILLLE